jgi:putative ABC transport system permease protein
MFKNFTWSIIMFKNYLKVALRNIKKHKGYSFINITGLAIGMACCLLIFLYVRDELSYDNYHKDLDRLYRVGMHFKGNWEVDFAKCGPPVGSILRRDFPQVEQAARLQKMYRPLVKNQEKMFYENRGYYTENELFSIFPFKFIEGNPSTALNQPHTLVLTENMAKKYFGFEGALGKTIKIDSEDFEVTGIIGNYPDNTHMKFDMLVSFKTIENEDMESAWGWTNFYTYVKLAPNVDADELGKQIYRLENLYLNKETLERRGTDNWYFLQPVRRIHLHSHLAGETEPSGDPLTIYITSTIGFLILLIACINFMNLTTARFSGRTNEVGMRKVVGAQRRQLIFQFLGESLLLSILSFLAALFIAGISLPVLNDLADKAFTVNHLFQFPVLLISILIILFVGITAGCYPSFFLSAFRPVFILKGGTKIGEKGSLLRKVLVVGQFAVSAFLLVGTIVVYKQMSYMKNSFLGFDKEQKLVLPVKEEYLKDLNFEPLKAEFLKYSRIKGAAVSSHVPGGSAGGWATILVGKENETGQPMNYYFVDYDFISEYRIELIAGRNFKKDMGSDREEAFLINESAVKEFGLTSPQESIGRQIEAGYGGKGSIIGVVKDFHFSGLQTKIRSLLMGFGPDKGTNRFNPSGCLTLTVSTDNVAETLSFVKEKWEEFHPNIPYSYYFINDIFDAHYREEEKTKKIFSIISFLGLFIACLGLFGLASFTVEQRTKEIGIRKVLGASVSNITLLLTKEFGKWVLLANIIAWPAAYYVMHKWLQDFHYRINIGLEPLLLSGGLVVVIALLTVSCQSIRAATADPVDSLRYE